MHYVEPRTFVLHLTQHLVSPSMMARKMRKSNSGKYLLAEPLEAAGREAARNHSTSVGELHSPMESPVLAVDMSSSMNEEVPLVLVVEPQAQTWARHIVHYVQTGELPEEQEEAERVAPRSSMYQFVNDTL